MNVDVANGKYEYTKKDEYQKNVLREFRRILQDVLEPHHDDHYLTRFLKARDFDIIKAEKMIREALKFRKKIKADTILTSDYELPEVVQKHKVTCTLGFDKDYNRIRLFMIGPCDSKGFAHSLQTVDLLKVTVYYLESEIKLMQEKRKKIPTVEEKITFILDFTNFSLKQFYDRRVIRTATEMLTMYQDMYPETLKTAYLVNVPTYFNWLFNIFKPVLNPVTLSKIKVYKDNYQQVLRTVIEPQLLPAFLGGDLTDPDGNPKCLTLVNWNPKIDTSYYIKRNQHCYNEDPSVTVCTIHQRSTHQVSVEVNVTGSVLKWTFWTKDYNIRFGLYYKRDGNGSRMEEILPVEALDCHIIPEENEFICNRPGTYVLHFDNSYSWLISKQIWYKVEVEKLK